MKRIVSRCFLWGWLSSIMNLYNIPNYCYVNESSSIIIIILSSRSDSPLQIWKHHSGSSPLSEQFQHFTVCKKKKNSSFDSGFPCETLKSLANSGQSPNRSVLVSTYSFIFEKDKPRGRSFFCGRIQWLVRTTHRAETIQMWVLQHPVSCFSLDYFGIPSYQVTWKILYCFYLWELLVFYLWELLCTGNIFLRNGEERKH